MTSCVEKTGDKVERAISSQFTKLGVVCGKYPRRTILLSILFTVVCGAGFMRWSTENRTEKLWVPQNTLAEVERTNYESYYESLSRFNNAIVQADVKGENVLTKDRLVEAMSMHNAIVTTKATVEYPVDSGVDVQYNFTDLCTPFFGACQDPAYAG